MPVELWKLRADATLEPIEIAIGSTDHTYTEVRGLLVGALKPGDDGVTSSVAAKTLRVVNGRATWREKDGTRHAVPIRRLRLLSPAPSGSTVGPQGLDGLLK